MSIFCEEDKEDTSKERKINHESFEFNTVDYINKSVFIFSKADRLAVLERIIDNLGAGSTNVKLELNVDTNGYKITNMKNGGIYKWNDVTNKCYPIMVDAMSEYSQYHKYLIIFDKGGHDDSSVKLMYNSKLFMRDWVWHIEAEAMLTVNDIWNAIHLIEENIIDNVLYEQLEDVYRRID